MGLWSWLFGRRDAVDLEEDGNRLLDVGYRDGKRHGPYRRFRKDGTLLEEGTYVDGEREGPFVIHGRDTRIEGTYRAGKLHGVHRVLRPDGSLVEEREYEHGEVVRGRHERRDDIHKNWIRERGTLVNGQRDGRWEEFGIPPTSARGGELGPLLRRFHYDHGVLDGPYETWYYHGNARDIAGQYRAGKRVGHWTYHRHDGGNRAELDYEDGAIVKWRWLARDGRERPVVEITDDEELERWLALGEAWDRIEEHGTYPVQAVVDQWSEAARARPLAWIDERIAAGERPRRWDAGAWLELVTDSDAPDPRTRYIDSIELDHHEWDAEQTRRLQRIAPQILELGLVECAATPDITTLFDVPWPKLESLSLHECGPVDDAIAKLYTSPLVDLALTHEPLSAAAIERLVAAPWFVMLQTLRVTVADRTLVEMLAARGMPELRELEIDCHGLALAHAEIAALVDREHRPTLDRLVLAGIEVVGELPVRAGVAIEVID